ncbi:MAG: hypothetical protein ACR2KK_18975 [Acidimicrobiales bacterium]
MRRLIVTLSVAVLVIAGCGGDSDDDALVVTATTTTQAPTTTTEAPTTTTAPVRTTTTTTSRPAATSTTVAEAVVASGSTAAGPWQLVAQPGGRAGLVCALLRGPFQFGGQVCNEASEQDANGNDTLRYSGAGDGSFFIGVSRPNVARVRMEVRGGSAVERATVAAPFTTAARFVALPLPAGATIRSLTALDSGGKVLTTFVINP